MSDIFLGNRSKTLDSIDSRSESTASLPSAASEDSLEDFVQPRLSLSQQLRSAQTQFETQATEYRNLVQEPLKIKLSPKLQILHDAAIKSLTGLEEPTAKEHAMSVQTYGTRLSAYLLRQKHASRADKLFDLSQATHEYLDALEALQKSANKEHKKQLQPHIHAMRAKLKIVDSLLYHADAIVRLDLEIQTELETKRPLNQTQYLTRVGEIRQLMAQKAPEKEIAQKMGELQTFDETLQKEYEGWDPYPSTGYIQQGESRVTPQQLVIEYSLAKLGLSTHSQAYQRALSELLPLLGKPVELAKRLGQLLADLPNFAIQHPFLASQMASSLAHAANLASGGDTAGAALQAAIYRKRIDHLSQDLLMGKKNQSSFEEECQHPLSLQQIILLDVISRMPYLVAAYEGSQGRTLGGNLGYQYAGPVGGVLGGLVHAKAQEILAESLNRQFEIYASAAMSVNSLSEHFRTSLTQMQTAYGTLSLDYEGVKALGDLWYAGRTAVQPLVQRVKIRNQLQKAGNFIKTVRKTGHHEAIQESAETTFSKPTRDELRTVTSHADVSKALFAYNTLKFIKLMKLLPKEVLEQIPESLNLGFLFKSIDWVKFMDKTPETILTQLRPLFTSQTNIVLEQTRASWIKTAFRLPESELYQKFVDSLKNSIVGQTAQMLAEHAGFLA